MGEVAVMGAGVAGSLVALLLSRHPGVKVRVFERLPKSHFFGVRSPSSARARHIGVLVNTRGQFWLEKSGKEIFRGITSPLS